MKIKFLPEDIEVNVRPGQSVLSVAQENSIFIRSVCKGVPSCAECRVGVVEGVNNVLPPMNDELDLIGTGYFVDNRRLACQMHCFGDLVIDLQEHVDKGLGNAKQPRGGIRKEIGASKARMGNILEEAEAKAVKIEMTEGEKKEAEALKIKLTHRQVVYSKKMESSSKPKPKKSNKNRRRRKK